MRKGKFLTFNLKGRKSEISGIVLDYNNEWILIKRCNDYMLDGYSIFRNEELKPIFGDYEKRASKIIRLKKYSIKTEPHIPIESLNQIFKYITKKHKLIQLDTIRGNEFDVVKYTGEKGNIYSFDELTANAKWRFKLQLPDKECQVISFNNDYLNSLKLITKF